MKVACNFSFFVLVTSCGHKMFCQYSYILNIVKQKYKSTFKMLISNFLEKVSSLPRKGWPDSKPQKFFWYSSIMCISTWGVLSAIKWLACKEAELCWWTDKSYNLISKLSDYHSFHFSPNSVSFAFPQNNLSRCGYCLTDIIAKEKTSG